jgi:uncharacterized protein YndB with AHSA1/START domain
MNWCHYRFRSVWELAAAPHTVYAVLERAEDYPRWWPQVRQVVPVDDRSGTARIRSVLPYDLVITSRERRRDPAAGVLEATMTGDVDGWARWTLAARETGGTGDAGGTRAVYEQEVVVRKPLLRRFAVPGRPFFYANHTLMMRAGLRGLTRHLNTV